MKQSQIKLFYLLVCFSFAVDFISKRVVLYLFRAYNTVSVVPDFFSITLSKNKGVAFSMFDGKVFSIIILSLVFIILIMRMVFKEKKSRFEMICYGMIVGGAIGNLFDRVVYGYVIDFLDFNLFGWDYPVFNFADSFIVIGVILLLVYSFRKGE